MVDKFLNVYKDQNIENAEFAEKDGSRFGSDVMRNVKELQVGSGSTVFRADQSGIWLGAATFADAPFSVDMDGNVIATSVTLTGYETEAGAQAKVDALANSLGDLAYEDLVEAAKLGSTVIVGGYIKTSLLTADNITAGTLTGRTVRTSSGNDRIEMKNDNTITFYASGQPRTFIANGILGFNTPAGVGSGSIYGFGTEELVVDTGDSPYHFGASSFFPDSFTADIGKSTEKWRDGWFSRDLNVGDDLFVTDNVDVGGDVDVAGSVNGTINATGGQSVFTALLGSDGTTICVLGFDAGILVYYNEA